MPKKSEQIQKKKRYTTPGGLRKIKFHNVKHSKRHCALCGKELMGIPTITKGVSKSCKVPNRPYAGVYCSSCMRAVLRKNLLK
ncbi:50S ribosomal protein L34e [Candidatus Tiddalikarchaeum anstoanum]|nr:50S ribosomal protein L34e [Candidatus Tiddalikarchaeum anstoanum]